MKYIDYVNIKQGTDSQMRFSSGNTLPLTTLPHAHAMFAPQTNNFRGAWYYHPHDRSFEGVRLTHQASPWVNDFSYFCFMPQTGRLVADYNDRWSGFRPKDAILKPHYMQYDLLRYRTRFTLAPTMTGAVMHVTVAESAEEPVFAVLPFDFATEIRVDEKNSEISGYTTSYTNAPYHDNFRIYFVFKFDCCIYGEMRDCGRQKNESMGVKLRSRDYTVRIATSYISEEQARLNLQRETANKSVEDIAAEAEHAWESLLARVEIVANEKTMRTFYSCMYRAFVYPNRFYELDNSGNPIHIDPENGEVKKGVSYTNNGFWDTYRTVYPFYSLVAPERIEEILEGYLNIYDDTGYLPRWLTPSEFNCMPGTLIEAVFADAIVKGLLSEHNARRALMAMVANSKKLPQGRKTARKCIPEYEKLGYVPFDKCSQSVNETLDCAYGDFCIAAAAETLGETEIAERYRTSAQKYKNLYDAETGFIRGKDSAGHFRDETFDSYMWGRDYTEGSVWQNGFAVPHDYKGLAELMGGEQKFIERLDALFSLPPLYTLGSYCCEIHEMTEMAAIDLGQCAISNQPSFHLPFLYAEFGQPEKSHTLVKRIATEFFSAQDNGYPGDEDNGTMACWYLFAVLGFYPTCPGKDTFAVSGPLVTEAILHIGDKCVDVAEKLRGKAKISYWEIMG